jgi:hypothetical protein
MGRTLFRGGGEECRSQGSDCEPDVAAHGVHRRTAASDSRGLHRRGACRALAEHGRATRGGRCGPCATVVHRAGYVAHRMPRTAAPSGMHAPPMSACNGSERRPRTYDARRGAAGNSHRSRSHGPVANATTAASLPPFDLPHDGTALAPPSPLCMRAERSGGVLCVQACCRRTRARNGGCCKQPVRAPVRDFNRPLSELCSACAACCPVYHRGATV